MGKTLDFTTRKKEYLTVKLNDEKKTVLMIGTPTKEILDEFIEINERVTEGGGADKEALDDVFRVCAKIMSFNKGGIKITDKYLAGFFDIDDVMVFFNAYGEFMTSITHSKN